MDYTKLFKEDYNHNAQNPRYSNDASDDEYGKRYNGYWKGRTPQGSLLFTFDNGHIYEITLDNTIYYWDKGVGYFIDKDIELAINSFLTQHEIARPAQRYEDEIISSGFIRVVVHRETRTVAISNIHLNPSNRHQGLGKKLISIIYDVCKRVNYKLHLVQMVESFYIRMLNRGAEVVVPYDTLEITDTTNLT
jgi:GNAT superfamily N-acetyltransferase